MKDKDAREKGRMDVIVDKWEPIPGKEDEYVFRVTMRPDPRVWELLIREDGKEAWYNKIDKSLMTMEEFEKLVKNMSGRPIVTSSIHVEDIEQYLKKSKDRTKKESVFLTNDQSLELVVIYFDIVESTKIVSNLTKDQISIFYQIFSNEIMRVIYDFGGAIYKSVGDEVIGFFPIPQHSWIPSIDNSIRCAQYMREVTKYVISPIYQSLSLPRIQCRIGMDYGEVQIVNIGVKGIYQSIELLGNVMNIAKKICTKAQPDEIALGEKFRRQLHTSYKLCCKEIDLLKINGLEYKVFHLTI